MIFKRYLRAGLVFIVIGFTAFIFANESIFINKSSPVPETEFDIHIVMTALIQPSIFNITLIDGVYESGQTPDCDFGYVIQGLEADPVNFKNCPADILQVRKDHPTDPKARGIVHVINDSACISL